MSLMMPRLRAPCRAAARRRPFADRRLRHRPVGRPRGGDRNRHPQLPDLGRRDARHRDHQRPDRGRRRHRRRRSRSRRSRWPRPRPRKARRSSSRSCEIKQEVTADLVKLRAERDGGNGPNLHSWGTSAEVRYFVKVPASTKVLLTTTNGHIEVVDVKAAAHARNRQRPDQRPRPRRRGQGVDRQRRRGHRAGVGHRATSASRPPTAASRCACPATPRPCCSAAPPTAA